MAIETVILLAVLMLLVALLYSSVGHAGASGYLAAMALAGVAPALMKPTSLVLNILVATLTTIQFARAGCFSWRLFWPVAVTSIPMAFVGGRISLPGVYYKPLVGVLLLYSAVRLFVTAKQAGDGEPRPPAVPVSLGTGGAIGLVSGLTGTGGGIFLTPLMLFARWADARRASGVSAAFILVNSISGLAGVASNGLRLPPHIALWAAAAVCGGAAGSYFGSRKLGVPMMRRLLALVLVIAGVKLLLMY